MSGYVKVDCEVGLLDLMQTSYLNFRFVMLPSKFKIEILYSAVFDLVISSYFALGKEQYFEDMIVRFRQSFKVCNGSLSYK